MSRLPVLHRKVLRDLWHLKSQMLAVAVVMACGISMFVALRSMHRWLRDTQADYYAEYRFGDVFAHVVDGGDRITNVLEAARHVGAHASDSDNSDFFRHNDSAAFVM